MHLELEERLSSDDAEGHTLGGQRLLQLGVKGATLCLEAAEEASHLAPWHAILVVPSAHLPGDLASL